MAVKLARSKVSEGKSSLKPGSVLADKYRIEAVLGEGGMGIVYAAHHKLLDQRVALKVLFDDAVRDKEACARFLQEARSAARLQSEHVARVMDIDTLDSGTPFIVMEYLEGQDLGQLLEHRRVFAPSLVVDYVMQALEAIAQAHAQGIIHRDLKPSNLFLATVPDGSQIIKVLDFGISKPTFGKVSRITSSRSVLGSPPYMSPEQVRSPRTVDTRTDIWATGILLYELLTRRMPFDGEEVGELFAAILEQEPNGIRLKRPDVPEGLERVIFRCLAKNRDNRYADVADLARALAPFGTGGQNKSVEKIASTLLRAEELSNPRRRVVASGVTPIASAFSNTTVPDDLGTAETDLASPAPELSPTASTVGRRRTILTFMPGTTKARIAAFAGGALAALAAVIVFLAMGRGTPHPATTPRAVVAPPPEEIPSMVATAAATIATPAAATAPAAAAPPADPAATTTADIPTTSVVALPTAAAAKPLGQAARPGPIAKPRVTKPPPAAAAAIKPAAGPTTGPAAVPAPKPTAQQDELKKSFEIWK